MGGGAGLDAAIWGFELNKDKTERLNRLAGSQTQKNFER
jgi:hypothetical protein